MYEEARRLHVELFADVFTDLDQALAACRALARLRLMAVLDARQFGRQRLAPGTAAFALASFAVTGVSGWHQLGLDRGQVGVDRFFKQLTLLTLKDLLFWPNLMRR